MFSRESLGKEIEERAHRNSFHEFGTVAGREMRINEALLVLRVMIIDGSHEKRTAAWARIDERK